ncbi:B3GALNT2 [Cervus elaphus hippelaphus]|uniref:B3GALNT2 n=1 Tax=Cervus elaphus hippelaphus TaxID=46360 RepID=A0A212CNR2_CEREH|nr:B3GALNT2 [Cervus elaphus hippelaphus]
MAAVMKLALQVSQAAADLLAYCEAHLIFVSAAAEEPRSQTHGPMVDHVTLEVALSSQVLKELTVLLPGGSKWVESGKRKKQSAQDLFRCFPCLGRYGGEAVTGLRGEVGDVGKWKANHYDVVVGVLSARNNHQLRNPPFQT